MKRFDEVQALCALYLRAYADGKDEVASNDVLEDIIGKLHQATMPLPPTLGIHVSDSVGMSSKFGG